MKVSMLSVALVATLAALSNAMVNFYAFELKTVLKTTIQKYLYKPIKTTING